MMKTNRQNIINILRSRKLMPGREFDIQCDTVNAILYQDIIDLYLFLSGVTNWNWVDSKGGVLVKPAFKKTIMNLVRDVISWPFICLNRTRVIEQLQQKAIFRGALQTDCSVLFLRTDHWFNIKSGGSIGHLSGVIHGLRALGYQCHVISTDQLAGVEEDDHFHLCEPIYRLGRNLPNMTEFLYNDQLVRSIGDWWVKLSPSFIYQRYSLGDYSGVVLKQKYKVPYVCEYNGSFPWVARQWGGRKLFHEILITKIELLNLKAADVVVVVSQSLKDELVARGIKEKKILVNPNGVDPQQYSPNLDGSSVRNKYNLGGKTVIGFIGTFGKWHGAEVLAEAFGRFLQEFPEYRENVRLLVIGDGPTMPQVIEKIEKYGFAASCITTGLVPQEEGPIYLAACDILVSPQVPNPDGTPFFGSPTKIFEYMAMGKGIVASELEQIGEILKHDRTAWMVKPGDVRSLIFGLKTLIDDVELRTRLGRAARYEVVQKYTWEEHTRKVIEKLKDCCEL